MKTNAIVRIILFSLTIVILTAMLLTGLGFSGIAFGSKHESEDIIYTTSAPAPVNATVATAAPLYANPVTDAEILRELKPGEIITILRQESVNGIPWALTSEGWVQMEHLNEESPSSQPRQLEGSSCSVDPTGIRELNIEWVAGDITIAPKAGIDAIQISESTVENTKHLMNVVSSGDKLTIQFSKSSVRVFGFNMGSELSKDLTVFVPENWICDELQLEVASANVDVQNMTIGSIDFDGASGTCNFVSCIVYDLDIDTASGDVTFSGELDRLDFDAASASFRGTLNNCPQEIDMDGMSGDLELALPADCGFRVNTDGLSSSFHSDFATTYSNGSQIYGDGRCRINVDGMSCDVYISKNTAA